MPYVCFFKLHPVSDVQYARVLTFYVVAAGGCKRNSTATQVMPPWSDNAPRGRDTVRDEEHEDWDVDEETRACK
jgi:hypothetical protein